ncbi:restriction endonuclease subunit S [Coprobacillus sp. AM42-12AC]|nr:restriction endonuclease subunit S [Coprobacillus sp. AM42-12AC]
MKCVLEDIADVTMGQSPKSEYYNSNKEGMPFLQGNRTFGRKYPTFDKYTTFITKIAKSGDVIMSVRAPVGDINITPIDVCLGRGVCGIRMKNGNQDFLYYLLKYYMPQLINRQSGTVFGSVNKNDINHLEINVPQDFTTQKKIANYLLMLDEKIELNEMINNNLLEQAKTLYKDWFFDFSPFSTDGSIPYDWRMGTVGDIIQLYDSKRVPLSGAKRDRMEKLYPYYGATSLMDYVDNYLFNGIFLLLGEDGTVVDSLGFPILQYVYGKFWVNNHAHVITGKEGFSVEELFLFFSLTNINTIVTGAVQQKVSQQNLKKVPAIIPTKEVLSAFDNIIQPIFAQIRTLRDENLYLADLRDALLPKLMSGELDVSDIDF